MPQQCPHSPQKLRWSIVAAAAAVVLAAAAVVAGAAATARAVGAG